jgi:cytochrome c-type biogenesis protein CcmH
LFLSAGAVLAQTPTVAEDPLERQMLEIAKELRCAVCQNQPISESNAELARDMREIVREQLKAGKTREEIIAYFVERYGNYVLLKPPYRGAGAAVWIMPFLLLGIIGVTGFLYLRRRLGALLPPPPPLSEQDAARVRALRRQESP